MRHYAIRNLHFLEAIWIIVITPMFGQTFQEQLIFQQKTVFFPIMKSECLSRLRISSFKQAFNGNVWLSDRLQNVSLYCFIFIKNKTDSTLQVLLLQTLQIEMAGTQRNVRAKQPPSIKYTSKSVFQESNN